MGVEDRGGGRRTVEEADWELGDGEYGGGLGVYGLEAWCSWWEVGRGIVYECFIIDEEDEEMPRLWLFSAIICAVFL